MASRNRIKLQVFLILFVHTATFCGVCFAESARKLPTATKALMHRKLLQTHTLLKGLMTGNKTDILNSLQELKTISHATSWYKLNDESFLRYRSNFGESVDRMIKYQKNGNYEGVSMGYIQLTLACMDCHQVVRGK